MGEEVVKKEAKFSNVQKNLGKFFKDVRSELKKVIWPNKAQLINNTATVIAACVIIGAIIWVADFGLTRLAQVVFK